MKQRHIKMNCREANLILISEYLFSIGIEPKKIAGRNYWYLSPLRDEKTPSFKVDTSINRWYDHGMGVGGKLVDLGIRLFEISVAEFLKKLGRPSSPFLFHKPSSKIVRPIIKRVKKINNRALLNYLIYRSINLELIDNKLCNEVYYSIGDKNFFAIGFRNDLGGFELRNKYFKGCIGPKGITTIRNGMNNAFALFEGFIDYLSALQEGAIVANNSIIILHSVNQIQQAITELQKYNPERIESYFDNDEPGKECFLALKSSFSQAINGSYRYGYFKDYNEMIMQTKTK